MHITDLIGGWVDVENDGDYGEKYSLDDFKNDVKRLSELVDPVSFQDTLKLVWPRTMVIMR